MSAPILPDANERHPMGAGAGSLAAMLRITLVMGLAGAALVVSTRPAVPAQAAQLDPSEHEVVASGVDVLERAMTSASGRTYSARAVVIGIEETGPDVTEMLLHVGGDGMLQVGSSTTWMVTRAPDDGVFWSGGSQSLVALGAVDAEGLSIDRLLEKYDLTAGASHPLETGPATAVHVRVRGASHDRERLYVDDATGLVVRRETFDGAGAPTRMIAFTSLEDAASPVAAPSAQPRPAPVSSIDIRRSGRREISPESFQILHSTGWVVPESLPRGFVLTHGYALPEEEGQALHLVYSDGLYTLSVYQQQGQLDPDARDGAAAVPVGDGHVWQWIGAHPQRAIWSRDDMTYTAISDAPTGELRAALAGLPWAITPSMPTRARSFAADVGRWLWPFD